MSKHVIFGAGGHGRELRFQLESTGHRVAAFVDEIYANRLVDELPVLLPTETTKVYPDALWHIAIGDIPARIRIVESLMSQNVIFGSFVSPHALISPRARIDAPAQVFANVVVSEGTHLERFCIVNFGCIISHDSRIGTFSYIAPGSCIAGHVDVEPEVWIGVGVSVRNGSPGRRLTLGRGATIGAGACVIRNVDPGKTVAGVPAREIVG